MRSNINLRLTALLATTLASGCLIASDDDDDNGGDADADTDADSDTDADADADSDTDTDADTDADSDSDADADADARDCAALCGTAQAGDCTSIRGDCGDFCGALFSVEGDAGCADEREAYEACLSDGAVCDGDCSASEADLTECVAAYCASRLDNPDCQTLLGSF